MSGGYAGAKRMLWIMAKYANGVSAEKGLGIYFQVIVPLQIIGGTGVGDAGANAYARAMGMEPEQFLARFGVASSRCPIPCGPKSLSMWGVEVGITPGRLKRWRDRPRHTLQQRC